MIATSLAILLISAQLATTSQPPGGADQPRLTAAGCVAGDAAPQPAKFTLFEPHRGLMYKLTRPQRALSGKRVQVVGGLLPTPNIAAQAGSIDPAIAATAATRVNLYGPTPFNRPKAHVETIRSRRGPCIAP
jgi:hypothetical protein